MGEPFKISIRDMEALIKVDLELEDGLNIVVGSTNQGKSAIIRSIKSAIFNIGDDEQVRAGKRYGAVQLDNGEHKIIFRRDSHGKNNKTLYQIDNNPPIEKVGRTQLPEVAQILNISDVRLSNNVKEQINFWDQGEKPFLTDRTSGQLFEFLSKSSCDDYLKVLKAMKEDRKTYDRKIVSIGSSIDTLKQLNDEKKKFLDINQGFDDVYNRTIILNSEIQEFNEIEELVKRIESSQVRIQIKTESLNKVNENLSKIDFAKIKAEYETYKELESSVEECYRALSNVQRKKDTLDGLNKSYNITAKLYDSKKRVLDDVSGKVTEIDNISVEISQLMPIVEGMNVKKTRLSALNSDLGDIKLKIDNIDISSFDSEIQELEGMEREKVDLEVMIRNIKSKKDVLESRVASLNSIVEDYNKASAEFNAFKDEIGICPYCGSELKEHKH